MLLWLQLVVLLLLLPSSSSLLLLVSMFELNSSGTSRGVLRCFQKLVVDVNPVWLYDGGSSMHHQT